jgi:hypothetical protein
MHTDLIEAQEQINDLQCKDSVISTAADNNNATNKATFAAESIVAMQESCIKAVSILNSLLQYDTLNTGEQLNLSLASHPAINILREAMRSLYIKVPNKHPLAPP